MPRPDGYIPEDEREPVQRAIITIPKYTSLNYPTFPTMHINEINIINSQDNMIDLNINYNNGALTISILEKL